jgi:SagB-type dehydrogenase family enzyme
VLDRLEVVGENWELPTPVYTGNTSVEEALLKRQSIREYRTEPLALSDISQLLWAAQGITRPPKYRTAPSAGALYPLEVYLVVGQVDGLPAGVYHYQPEGHALVLIASGDKRDPLSVAALNQAAVKEAAAVIVIGAVFERTTSKYGERGNRYVHMEVGAAAQNAYLQAASLDLGTVFIGAFYDDQIQTLLALPQEVQPLGLMPVGRK